MNDRLRIGDAERETAARELGEHFALGRIDADEHSERLELVWAARTAADLAPAFRDLPRPRTAAPGSPRSARLRPVESARGWPPEIPRLPFLFKLLLAIVLIWWGFHHPLFLLVAVVVYVVFVRRFIRRGRWHGRYSHGPYGHGRTHTGWH